MARKVFFLLIILISQFCFSQSKTLSKIDSLETELEAQSFMRSCSKNKEDYLSKFNLKTIQSFNNNYYHHVSEKIKQAADSLGINKSFYKGDFDHNGTTDLLFIGDNTSCEGYDQELEKPYSCNSSIKVILDLEGKYEVKDLLPNHFDFVVPLITKIDNKDYVSVFGEELTEYLEGSTYRQNYKMVSKILDYKYANFIEYNAAPISHSIKKIEYSTGICFGTCPSFSMEIHQNGNAKFIAKAFNFTDEKDPKSEEKAYKALNKGKDEGHFEAKLKPEDFNRIQEMLNYIDFSNLKDDYWVNWTDDQSSTLTVTFNNGKKKKIKDYGLVGTYGLKNFYTILFDLRFNQDWKKIK